MIYGAYQEYLDRLAPPVIIDEYSLKLLGFCYS